MKCISRTLGAVTAVVAITACSAGESLGPGWPDLPSGAAAVQFNLIDDVHTSQMSGIDDRRRLVIRTPQEWEAFWAEFVALVLPPPETPVIDFDQQMVIAVTMGTRNTGGYAISVEGIFTDDATLFVRVVESSPGATCVLPQVLTAPATAVTLIRSDTNVEFQEGTATAECS